MATNTSRRVATTVRLDPRLLATLRADAKAAHRSLSKHLELIIVQNTPTDTRDIADESLDTPAEHDLRLAFRELKAYMRGEEELPTIEEFLDELKNCPA